MTRFLAVFLLLVSPLAAQDSPVSPAPGRYSAPLTLSAKAPEGAAVSYRFRESPSDQPWTSPVTLDALPGEIRSYVLRVTTLLATGESTTRDFRYTVVRPSLELPKVQPEPGRYTEAVTVRATIPAGWTVVERGIAAALPRTLDAVPGGVTSLALTAQGPGGERLDWNYTVDRRDQEVSLDVLSPLPGNWANPQPLVVVFRGLDQVVWSLGDRLSSPADYRGPLALPSGTQKVTVGGRTRTGEWVTKTVAWTAGDAVLPEWQPSGAAAAVAWPAGTISWDEGRSWKTVDAGSEKAGNSRKVLAAQVRSGTLYRYVYWLDARTPPAPSVSMTGGWNPQLVVSSASEVLLKTTWLKKDSTEEAPPLWGPVAAWKIPDGVVGAKVTAVGANAQESAVSTLAFSETGWSTPVWEPLENSNSLPLGGRVAPRLGFWPVYEVSDTPSVKEPDAASSLLEGAFVPTFPSGSDRTLYARFAWRDAGGLVGPASAPVAVRVDRVPPRIPDVLTVGGQVILKAAEGEEDGTSLLWAATSERVLSANSLVFQPYGGSLAAATLAGGGRLWFHAIAQDRSGNLGPARLNVALAGTDASSVVQVDVDPSVGETPVRDGGVYPWPTFRLRALDAQTLWVGVAEQSVPADWASRVQPWTGVFSRSIARGERRAFLVYWNAKTADGWAWTEPKTLALTLDLSAPPAPEIAWPEAPGGSWSLTLAPARTGDRLRYSFTLDGTSPPDPLVAGEAWPGTRTWEAPPAGRAILRLRVAALSVTGLTAESTPGAPLVLDRSPPPLVAPRADAYTYRSSPYTVELPAGARVRYTLTTDGTLPAVPTEASPLVPFPGLLLEGKAGATVFYRYRWRSYSAAGQAGQPTDAYAALIDRTATTGATAEPAAAVVLKGVPSGASPAPVTLELEGASEGVRYEVREGLGSPAVVTADSAPWSGPLVLDGGEGVDRSFAVSLRRFSPDGLPLSAETVQMVRVDRSFPAGPEVTLTPDARRPEAVLKAALTDGDETLTYRWTWTTFEGASGTSDWLPLSGTAVFTAPGGSVTRLSLEAVLRDEAGNQGPIVTKSLLVDQNAVYVDAEGRGDGSRAAPMNSLADAVDKARREGKSLLLLGDGTLKVSRTLDVGGLRLVGGLSASWEPSGRTVINAATPFAGRTLFESEDRGWSLSNVDFSGTARLDHLIAASGGDVSLRNTAWTWTGAGWQQQGGTAELINASIAYTAVAKTSLLEWNAVEGEIRGLKLSASQNQDSVVFSFASGRVLLRDLVMVSKDASGFDGVLAAVNTVLTVDQARIQAGDGAERSTALSLKGGEATLWNLDVSLYGSVANTGIQVSGGAVEVQKSSLSLVSGTEFNQGLVLDHARTELRSLDVKIDSGSYQGALSVDGGSVLYATGKVRLSGGGKRVWGGQFLSPTEVHVDDVTWSLAMKTAGELWQRSAPWVAGSSGGAQTAW